MPSRAFKQVDVFTGKPYFGNPLAVVLDGTGLSDDDMQRFAGWTNLSETTFLLPPTEAGHKAGADYRVRIFTPGGELPFAGHPTLGSCHAWLEAGGAPHAPGQILQECALGLVPLRRDGPRLAFAAPPLKRSSPSPELLDQVTTALGLQAQQVLEAQMLNNGPVWLGLLLDCPETVLQLTPDHLALAKIGQKVGVAGVFPSSSATHLISRSNPEANAFTRSVTKSSADTEPQPTLEVRAFAAPLGVNEDPVTGSLNASLAQWLIFEGRLTERYLASQGTCLAREGRIFIERDPSGQVWVGGESMTCVNGQVSL